MRLVELIGNTPLIELEHIPTNPNVKILCKLEGQNPGGSVKDRAAYNMLQAALERGEIKRWDKLVEAYEKNEPIMGKLSIIGKFISLILPIASSWKTPLTPNTDLSKYVVSPSPIRLRAIDTTIASPGLRR